MGQFRDFKEGMRCSCCGQMTAVEEYNDFGGPETRHICCNVCGYEVGESTGSGIWEDPPFANRRLGLAVVQDGEKYRIWHCAHPVAEQFANDIGSQWAAYARTDGSIVMMRGVMSETVMDCINAGRKVIDSWIFCVNVFDVIYGDAKPIQIKSPASVAMPA